ncbi:MAG: helix-turn-helix transcriptional regulator [Candidatus Coproplasma sp.]
MVNKVAIRIKEIRMENKLNQTEFGKILSVSQDTVSLWEKGKSFPTVEAVITISEKFNVSADYILGLKDF